MKSAKNLIKLLANDRLAQLTNWVIFLISLISLLLKYTVLNFDDIRGGMISRFFMPAPTTLNLAPSIAPGRCSKISISPFSPFLNVLGLRLRLLLPFPLARLIVREGEEDDDLFVTAGANLTSLTPLGTYMELEIGYLRGISRRSLDKGRVGTDGGS